MYPPSQKRLSTRNGKGEMPDWARPLLLENVYTPCVTNYRLMQGKQGTDPSGELLPQALKRQRQNAALPISGSPGWGRRALQSFGMVAGRNSTV